MPTLKAGSLGVTLSGGTMIGVPAPHSGPEWSGVPGFSAQSLFEVTAGELPPGLSIAQKAVGTGTTNQFGWKGTPLALGTWTATIGPSGTFPGGDFEWTISLAPACPLVPIDPDAPDPGLPAGVRGKAYAVELTASVGVAPYAWDLLDDYGLLPDGLTLTVVSSESAVIAGIPTTLGDFSFVVRATDANGCPGVRTYTLSIVHGLIEIDGEDATDEIAQADFELGLNQRSTARLVFGDGFIPDRLAEVVLYARDRVTPVFGGLILSRRVRGEVPGILANATEGDCVDFSIYFDDASVTLSYDAPVAVEDVIADMVDQALGDYGLTYTPTVTGLTVEPFAWVDVIVTDAFRQLSEQTGLVFRTSPTKAILAIVPLAEAAPVTITDANFHAYDLTVMDGARLTANVVELLCGPSGPGLMRQQWVADGIATSWVTDLPAIDPPPILVEVDDGITPYLATVVALGAGGGQFEWDRDTHTLSLGTDPLPAAGTLLTLGSTAHFDSPFTFYTVQFPFKVRVPDGSLPSPPVTYREARPDLVEIGPAREIAIGILARESVDRKDVEVATDEDGFFPGQALPIDTTARGGLVADFLIANVRGHIVKSNHWEYTLTAQQAEVYQGSYVDQWKALTSGGGGTAAGTVSAPTDRPLVVVEADLSLSDITTANVSTTKHGFAPKAPGDATKFLNGANPPAWTVPAGSGGGVTVQVVNTQTGAAATGTTVIPSDDTIPQNTEGTEFMSLSITPSSATNKLKIEVVAILACSLTNNHMIGALFQDSTANALAAAWAFIPTTAGVGIIIHFTHYMTAGTTSATTFKFRAGPGFGSGTVTFNGGSGVRQLGGAMASSITITEIAP